MPAQTSISANDGKDWRIFVLKVYGADIDKNMAKMDAIVQLFDHQLAEQLQKAHQAPDEAARNPGPPR